MGDLRLKLHSEDEPAQKRVWEDRSRCGSLSLPGNLYKRLLGKSGLGRPGFSSEDFALPYRYEWDTVGSIALSIRSRAGQAKFICGVNRSWQSVIRKRTLLG